MIDANINIGSLLDTQTGVYVGCMYQEYTQLQYNLGYKISPSIATGNGISYLVGRLSYNFGLTGPSISTDTACSSSLVAANLAHKVGFIIILPYTAYRTLSMRTKEMMVTLQSCVCDGVL